MRRGERPRTGRSYGEVGRRGGARRSGQRQDQRGVVAVGEHQLATRLQWQLARLAVRRPVLAKVPTAGFRWSFKLCRLGGRRFRPPPARVQRQQFADVGAGEGPQPGTVL